MREDIVIRILIMYNGRVASSERRRGKETEQKGSNRDSNRVFLLLMYLCTSPVVVGSIHY